MRNASTVLQKALAQLEICIGLTESALGKSDERLAAVFRTASIKAFEYSYALSLKAIERRLTERLAPDVVESLTFRTFMRAAWEQGLVLNADAWSGFRDMRNATPHTYDFQKAAQMSADLPRFMSAAKYLVTRLNSEAQAS